jgi:hypothetical protein
MNNAPGSPLSSAATISGGGIGREGQYRRRSGFGIIVPSGTARNSPLSLENGVYTANEDGQEEVPSLVDVSAPSRVESASSKGGNGQAQLQHQQLDKLEPAVLMEQLMSVQTLLERFEKRLLVRESELIKKEKEAIEQMEKLSAVVVM